MANDPADPGVKTTFRTNIPGIPDITGTTPFPDPLADYAAGVKKVVNNPINYCPAPPAGSCNIYIRMPFGAPPIQHYSRGCEACQVIIPQITMSMGFLFPFLTMIGCFVQLAGKILNVVNTNPAIDYQDGGGLISSIDTTRVPFKPPALSAFVIPFDPPAFHDLTDFLTNKVPEGVLAVPQFFICIGDLISFLPQICPFIIDVLRTLAGILGCLLRVINTIIANSAEITRLDQVIAISGNLNLAKAQQCLKINNDSLRASMTIQINALQAIITLINLLVDLIPGLRDLFCSSAKLGCDPSKPFIDLQDSGDIHELLTVVTNVRAALVTAYNAIYPFCGAAADPNVPETISLWRK